MKKVLYGTTALVAAGVMGAGSAEAKIDLGLSGYMNTYFSVASINEGDNDPAGLQSDRSLLRRRGALQRRVHATTASPSARTCSSKCSARQLGGDTIDEKYAYVDGSFGRIVAGSENSAAYIMHYAAPYVGLPVNSGWVTVFIPAEPGQRDRVPSTPGVSTYIDYGSDDNASPTTRRASGASSSV